MLKWLEYPINVDEILLKKKALRRELLSLNPAVEKKIAILGGSTTHEIKNILELFLLKKGIRPLFYESEFNRFYEDALFGNDALDTFNPDIIYIHTTVMNIEEYPAMHDSPGRVEQILENTVSKFSSVWTGLKRYHCAVIQNNFELPLNRFMGNLDSYDIHGRTHFINNLNLRFARCAREIPYVYVQDIHYLSAHVGLTRWYDLHSWYASKYAVSHEAIPHLAANLSRIISALFGMSRKALVVDLDNTCWGGTIGDDGVDNIQIGRETPVAESFLAFQSYIVELKKRGVLLAIASKNELQSALEGLAHPDSVLHRDDFSSCMVNWRPKSENILAIANELCIGLDSLVFIDDNPMERDIVSLQVPQVAVPDAGSDVVFFSDYLEHNGYFEKVALSEEDLHRSAYYRTALVRVQEETRFAHYNDYLVSLTMTAVIHPFEKLYLDRITQLINKTNQFNLTTRRYTAGEIEAIGASPDYCALYGKLTDRLGDHGLIAIVIGSIRGKECHLDLWLMSCRVLKRTMEHAMLNEVVRRCRGRGVERIVGYYFRTPKNDMVSRLFSEFGFTVLQSTGDQCLWELNVNTFLPIQTFIKVAHDG